MDTATQDALERLGLPIVAVVFLAIAFWWAYRERIADLKTTRDEAIAGWRAQTAATDKLTDAVSRLEQRLVDELGSRRGTRS